MTNGEKLVKVFPDIELYKKMHGGIQIDFDSVWWNAEYKEPTTKNDLGVDAISRKELDKALYERFHEEDSPNNITEIRLGAVRDFIKNFPSVTSQTRQGHWTEEFNDLEGEVRFTCSSCGKYQLFGTDFCYHCGSDNREVGK